MSCTKMRKYLQTCYNDTALIFSTNSKKYEKLAKQHMSLDGSTSTLVTAYWKQLDAIIQQIQQIHQADNFHFLQASTEQVAESPQRNRTWRLKCKRYNIRMMVLLFPKKSVSTSPIECDTCNLFLFLTISQHDTNRVRYTITERSSSSNHNSYRINR